MAASNSPVSFVGFDPNAGLTPAMQAQLAQFYANPQQAMQYSQNVFGNGQGEIIDDGSGYAFAPKFREVNGNQIFDGGTLYQHQYTQQDYSPASYVFNAQGQRTDPGFQLQVKGPNAMDKYGFAIPLAAPFVVGGLQAALAGYGAAGGTGAGLTTAEAAGVGSSVIPEGAAFTAATPAEMAAMGVPAGAAAAGTGAAGLSAGAKALGTATSGSSALSSLGGWGSLIAPALNAIGGAITADAAGNAADTMAGAAQSGIDEQRRQFDTVRGLLQPYVQAGTGALGAYQNLSGLGGADAQQAEIAALQNGPQFGALTKAGENAILQNASATGGLRGGNVQGALADRRTQILSGLIDQQLGRYGSLIGVGQNAAAGTGSAAMQTGTNVANLLGQQGAALAGGTVSATNAITGALGNVGGFFAGQQAAQVPAAAPPVDLRNGMNFGSGVVQGFTTPRMF